MNKSTQEFILIILGILAFALFVYFVIRVIDAITHPSVVWWGIGFASCLVVEGLIWFGVIAKRNWRDWFDTIRQWFRDTFSSS